MQYVPPLNATDPNASYVEGNPAAGLRGSYPTASGYEAIMREIVNAISAFGETPNPNNLNQLGAAIRLGGKLIACFDESIAANTYLLAGQPTLPDYEPMQTFFWLPSFAATGPSQIGVDGHGLLPLLRPDGTALQNGDIVAQSLTAATMMANAQSVRLTAIPPSSLANGEGIGLPGGKISFAFPSLVANQTISAPDLLAFYAMAAEGGLPSGHHYKITFAALVAAILANISQPVQALIPPMAAIPGFRLLQSGTYVPTPGARLAVFVGTGGGGGGGGTSDSGSAAGGSAGATAVKFLNLAGIVSLPVAVGAGGTPGAASSGTSAVGGTGGTTSIGSILVAGGGTGQQTGGGSLYRASAPGPGGIATAGDLLIPGGTGAGNIVPTDTGNFTGASGGASIWGGGGAGSYFTPYNGVKSTGQDGQAPGSGGGGASATLGYAAPGGAGAPGLAFVIETF